MKFAISRATRNDRESATIVNYCVLNKIEYKIIHSTKDFPLDYIPVGNVPWVSEILGGDQTPDYYPEFLSSHLHRKIWRADKWPYGHRVFIKPADKHKRFTGFVTTGTWKGKKKSPYWCSEIVNFVTEWRYYVAAGKVIDSRYGSGIECDPPVLEINFPQDYFAALDFGRLDNGKLALVESNSPFACGWYGPMGEGEIYAKWLDLSWQHLKKINNLEG